MTFHQAMARGRAFGAAGILWGSLLCTVIVLCCVLGGAWLMAPAHRSTLEKVAQLGDSSAILGTLFSGLAFVILIVTLRLQWQELGLQREELKATRAELRGSREAQVEQAQWLREAARLKALSTLAQAYTDMSVRKDLSYPVDPDIQRYRTERDTLLAELRSELDRMPARDRVK